MKTYIDYILSFWRRRLEKPLSSNQAYLYLYLLHQCNLLRFKNPFEMSTEVIIEALDMNICTFRRARKALQEEEYITFKSSSGRSNRTTYTIIEVPISDNCCSEKKGTNLTPFSPKEKVSKSTLLEGHKKVSKSTPFQQEKVSQKVSNPTPLEQDTPIIDIFKDNRHILYEHNSVCVSDEEEVKNSGDLVDVKDGILQAVIRQNHQSWIEVFCMNNHISPQAFGVSFDIWCKHILDQGTTKTTVAEAKKHFANWYKLQVRIKTEKQNGTNYRQTNSLAEQRRLQAEQRNQERMQRIYAECGVSYPGDTSTQRQISNSNSTNGGIPSETGEYPFE